MSDTDTSLMLATEPDRNPDGTFQKGVSGNPNGRPRGTKNQLTALKQNLELAVRENLQPAAIRRILNRMTELAMEGNVGAAKLILDKVLSNARDSEETEDHSGTFVFKVKNLTIKSEDTPDIIDVTPQKGD